MLEIKNKHSLVRDKVSILSIISSGRGFLFQFFWWIGLIKEIVGACSPVHHTHPTLQRNIFFLQQWKTTDILSIEREGLSIEQYRGNWKKYT